MSELLASCFGNNRSENGINPIFMIMILLFLCGGDNGLFGCGGGSSCNGSGGLDGILPILLILCLCGGMSC